MSHTVFDGSAGRLEGYLEEGSVDAGAVLCHPHPLYGGSMDDMVLQAIASPMTSSSMPVLRFNFRGVGASEGDYDKGEGEVDDLLSAIDHLRSVSPCREVIVAGYSFGAAVALKAARTLDCSHLMLVAPPLSLFRGASRPVVPTLVIVGEADQLVDSAETAAWFEGAPAVIESIAGADHFFFGAHDRISQAVAGYLGKHYGA